MNPNPVARKNLWLRTTLVHSRRDAVASSVMTGICDNFFGAFAVHLRAGLAQIGWLTAAPQLVGAAVQLLSVWVGSNRSRRRTIVSAAALQAVAVLGLAILAFGRPLEGAHWLILLAVVYHAAANFNQPQWRDWMGSLVPPRRRGAFFAGRARLTMITSFLFFVGGGMLLGAFEVRNLAWLGFGMLYLLASAGRFLSAWHLGRMHDPDYEDKPDTSISLGKTLQRIRESFRNRTFREYSLFFAGIQAAVAISGPFFSVYMLRDLQFSYLQFTANTAASILTQFFTLSAWGLICDRSGNRLVMVVTSGMIPFIPALWLFSDNFYYLMALQVLAGLAWGGFTLSTANYLYDLRPPRADFATYAAVQSGLSALGIFAGALFGGYLANSIPGLVAWITPDWHVDHPVLAIFAVSALLRLVIVIWFIPRSVELRVRQHPGPLKVVYRISRFTPGAGIVLDWLTVARRRSEREQSG